MRARGVCLALAWLWFAGCSPRVGSDAWCADMKEKPKGEWTLDEGKSYAKYCVLGMNSERWCEALEEKPKGDWTAREAAEYAKSCLLDRDAAE